MSSYDKNQAYSTEWSDDEQPTAFSGNENGGNGNSFEDDSSTGRGVRVRALYDYEGQEQDELSFKAGNYRAGEDFVFEAQVLVAHPYEFWIFICVSTQHIFNGVSSHLSNPSTKDINTHLQPESSHWKKTSFVFSLNETTLII